MSSDLIVAISNAVVAVAAVIGLVQVWRAISDRREDRKNERLDNWRSAFFHKYFSTRPDEVIAFQKLLSDYRVEASAYEGGRLASAELSDARLRRILLELSKYRHIKVVGPDQFQLEQGEIGRNIDSLNRAMSESMAPIIQGVMGPVVQRGRVEASILSLLREHSEGLTFNELKLMAAKALDVEDHDVEARINLLLAATILYQRDGRVFIGDVDPRKVLAMKLGEM